MSKTTVLYKDVAPGAADNAQMSAELASGKSQLGILPKGIEPSPVATLERNNWVLNGKFVFQDSQQQAFWSTEMSGADGVFVKQPVIAATFTQQFSSTGITLVFDRAAGNYCSQVNVKWYQGDTLKANVDFYPDAVTYFCEQIVTSYDKVVVTFVKTALPGRYAKVEHIVFGVERRFGMSELRSASVINEMDGIVETLPISTFKWTLDSRDDVNFLFQLKQPVEIRNDDNLLGVYYVDKHNRKTGRIYDIECYDALGVLDEIPFVGGVYTDKSAKKILTEIVGSDFEIEYGADVVDIALTGILESGTKRSAIQQVLFAWGVCMATDGGDALRVFNLDSSLMEIGQDRTFPGVAIETAAIVTEVQVTAHSYVQDTSGNIEIGGVRYSDTQSIYAVKNPDVTANDKQNVKEFKGATLVSPGIAQTVAQRIYDWYLRRNTVRASIVWTGDALGDFVGLPNSWDGSSPGSITKMEIKLSNTVVAKCEAVG